MSAMLDTVRKHHQIVIFGHITPDIYRHVTPDIYSVIFGHITPDIYRHAHRESVLDKFQAEKLDENNVFGIYFTASKCPTKTLIYNVYFKPVYICFNTILEFKHYGHINRMVYVVYIFYFKYFITYFSFKILVTLISVLLIKTKLKQEKLT